MFLAHRRIRLWTLMALMALLPWRAWAWAAMAPAQVWTASPMALAVAAEDDGAPPCHLPPQAGHPATSPAEPPDSPAAQMCAHCDICHASLAPPQHSLALPTAGVPGYGPSLGPVHLPEHRLDALFKPPRLGPLTL